MPYLLSWSIRPIPAYVEGSSCRDLEALVILLNVLHCRTDCVPKTIPLELFAKLGVLIDYYQCRPATRFFTDIWYSNVAWSFFKTSNNTRDLAVILYSSWMASDVHTFKRASRLLTLSIKGPVQSLDLPIPERITGMSILLA